MQFSRLLPPHQPEQGSTNLPCTKEIIAQFIIQLNKSTVKDKIKQTIIQAFTLPDHLRVV